MMIVIIFRGFSANKRMKITGDERKQHVVYQMWSFKCK